MGQQLRELGTPQGSAARRDIPARPGKKIRIEMGARYHIDGGAHITGDRRRKIGQLNIDKSRTGAHPSAKLKPLAMDTTMNGKKARSIRQAVYASTSDLPYRDYEVVKTKTVVANVRGEDGKLRPQRVEHKTFGLIENCTRKQIKMLKRAA